MTATISILQDRQVLADGLVWENPPEKSSRPGKYAGLAAALRDRPGQWAVVRTYDKADNKKAWSFTTNVNAGKYVDLRDGFEAVARTVDGHVRVYARLQPVTEAVSS